MASDFEQDSLSSYRKLLVDLSSDLSKKEVETLKLAGVDFIPRRMTENIATGLQFFDVLEQDERIGPQKLNPLQDMLKTVGRVDLARKIQAFLKASVKDEIDGKMAEKFDYKFFYQSKFYLACFHRLSSLRNKTKSINLFWNEHIKYHNSQIPFVR